MDPNRRQPLPMSDEASAAPLPGATGVPSVDPDASLEEQAIAVLKTVYDPEIPVDIYELGLIYDLQIDGDKVTVHMTLTSPACPVAGSLPGTVQSRLESIPGISKAVVELVWDPPWDMERMSEAARLQLGLF